LVNPYTMTYAQRLEHIRAEKHRKRQQALAAQAYGVAGQIQPSVQAVEPSVAPYIPVIPQAQFEAERTAQRTAKTPFGVEMDVGAKTGAMEQRGKPEFGTWFGSGIAENIAGGALPILEQLQKGIETFGGGAVRGIGAVTPGDFMGYEGSLREVKKEREGGPGFFDLPGQAQLTAEAFRRTDMPSFALDIIPGEGIELPGDKRLNEINLGVKGAIELLPEVVIGIATGGTSAAGSLAKRTGISVANALGADIAKAVAKGSIKGLKKASTVELKSISDAARHMPTITLLKAVKDVEVINSKQLRDMADRLPRYMKEGFTRFWEGVNPAQIGDTSNAAVKLSLAYLKGFAKIDGGTQAVLAGFARRAIQGFGQAAKAPVRGAYRMVGETGEGSKTKNLYREKHKVFGEMEGPVELHHGTLLDFDPENIQVNVQGEIWLTDSEEAASVLGNLGLSSDGTVLKQAGAKTFKAGQAQVHSYSVKSGAKIHVIDNAGRLTEEAMNTARAAGKDADIIAIRNVQDIGLIPPNVAYYIVKNPDVLIPTSIRRSGEAAGTKLPFHHLSKMPGQKNQIFGTTEEGFIDGLVDEKTGELLDSVNGKNWTEVFENFFTTDRTKARKVDVKKRPFMTGVDVGDIVTDEAGNFIRYKGGNASEFATFLRHYQDTISGAHLHYIARGGKIKRAEKLDFASSLYIPRRFDGGSIFEELRDSGIVGVSSPGTRPRSLKERSLTNEQLHERLEAKDFTMAGPMEVLEAHTSSMYKAGLDLELNKQMRVEAKRAGSGVRDFASEKRRVQRIMNKAKADDIYGKRIQKGTLTKLEDTGFGNIAFTIRELRRRKSYYDGNTAAKNAKVEALQKLFEDDVKEITGNWHKVDSLKFATKKGQKGTVPAYVGLLFENPDDVKRLLKAHKLDEAGRSENLAQWSGEVGDVMRVMRTGFDFGFWLIQGLPTLGLVAGRAATGNFAEAAKLSKAWGKSVKVGAQALFDKDRLMKTMMENMDIVDEALGHGLQFSRGSTDIFQAIHKGADGYGGILRRIPKAGEKLDDVFTAAARPFERAFIAPGDLIRLEYYRAMRNTALKAGPEGLDQLAGMLNKMTGAMSSDAAGISRFVQAVERGILFFSPRYTRSSISLLSDFVSGGLEGRLARESLLGMLGLGVVSYVTLVESLNKAGVKQELHLDPSESSFMTFNIGDDVVGVGGFWTQFAKLTSRLAETAWDEDARQEFMADDTVRTNPIIRFIRGRSAPFAGIGWDIAVGEDYLGRPIESSMDWTNHIGTQSIPIWMEAGLIANPYRTGPVGVAGELLGARIRPQSASERRRDLRNRIAVDIYDKEWVDLNGLERKKITEGTHSEVLPGEHSDLEELSALVMSQRIEIGEEEDINIERYHNRQQTIEDRWIENIHTGLDHLSSRAIDLGQFRQEYLSSSNAVRRQALEELNDEDGEYSLAITYFREQAEKFGEDRPEDVAYNQYITDIVATDKFERPAGHDFRAQKDAIAAFRQIWGDEVYAYVQQRFREGRTIPSLVHEYWRGRQTFMNMYWRDVEEAVFDSLERSQNLRNEYQKWLEATANEQYKIENTVPGFKAMLNQMGKVRLVLRKKHKMLDAWLFRWGHVNTLEHSENRYAPDGFDAREFWRNPEPIALEIFGIPGDEDTVLLD